MVQGMYVHSAQVTAARGRGPQVCMTKQACTGTSPHLVQVMGNSIRHSEWILPTIYVSQSTVVAMVILISLVAMCNKLRSGLSGAYIY